MEASLVTVILVVAAVVALVWFVNRERVSKELRGRFGPEYDRALREHGGDRRRAEASLEERARRVERLPIHPLNDAERAGFTARWHALQGMFVDEPTRAAGEADVLVTDVMSASGYPTDDFEQRAADVSVDHPGVVDRYRRAHTTAVRSERGEADTEEIRQALVSFRELFEELTQPPRPVAAKR
jgi:hypothetical protein